MREVAKHFRDTIRRLAPELYEEIEGIAEGAGVDVLDVVALNARSEIALGLFTDGCTSVGLKMRRDEDEGEGGVWLSQNWDWTARVKRNLALMSIEQEGKPKIWMVTEVCLSPCLFPSIHETSNPGIEFVMWD